MTRWNLPFLRVAVAAVGRGVRDLRFRLLPSIERADSAANAVRDGTDAPAALPEHHWVYPQQPHSFLGVFILLRRQFLLVIKKKKKKERGRHILHFINAPTLPGGTGHPFSHVA